MIVTVNKPSFDYDIHSLVKAFYPYEDVSVKVCEDTNKDISKSADEGKNLYEADRKNINDDINKDIGKDILDLPDIKIVFEVQTSSEAGIDGQNEWDKDCRKINVFIRKNEEKNTENKTTADQVNEKRCDQESDYSLESVEFEALTRPDLKNKLKQLLYRSLSKHLNKELPWGTLTGIRPTKIPMKMLYEDKSDAQIYDYMKETYLASDEKIDLSLNIAKREKAILSGLHGDNGYSLYVGIPFCPTTCLYCSFTSYPIAKYRNLVDEYIDTLKKEIEFVATLNKGKILDTVYIGGGTPTTLQPYQFDNLIGCLKENFDFANVVEFTVEAGRPDSITREKLETLYNHGVNRISINPQTMNDETLKIIGRNHNVEQTIAAFKLAREVGFENINMDIILGLPGEDADKVKYTMSEIAKLSPDSLTVHSMAIKRAAGMAKYLEEHDEIKSINTPEMMDIAANCADIMGMQPYYLYRQKNMAGNFENVGYAQPDKFGIYNILIMEEVQTIIACGAGTVTKRVYGDGRIERCDNVKDVGLYIEKIDEMIERKRRLFEDEK